MLPAAVDLEARGCAEIPQWELYIASLSSEMRKQEGSTNMKREREEEVTTAQTHMKREQREEAVTCGKWAQVDDLLQRPSSPTVVAGGMPGLLDQFRREKSVREQQLPEELE